MLLSFSLKFLHLNEKNSTSAPLLNRLFVSFVLTSFRSPFLSSSISPALFPSLSPFFHRLDLLFEHVQEELSNSANSRRLEFRLGAGMGGIFCCEVMGLLFGSSFSDMGSMCLLLFSCVSFDRVCDCCSKPLCSLLCKFYLTRTILPCLSLLTIRFSDIGSSTLSAATMCR